MAAEIVETNRLWARTVGGIDPAWIGTTAAHLLEPVHGDPEWEASRGAAMATEHRTLRGLRIPGSRRVPYAAIDPWVARRMFIDEGLVRGEMTLDAEFLSGNRKLQEDIERREARLRRRDLLASEQDRAAFYESRLPGHIADLASLKSWLASASSKETDRLQMAEADLLRNTVKVADHAFPEHIDLAGTTCSVRYGFEPGAEDDGLCVTVPLAILPGLDFSCLEWLVPGLIDDKIESIIRGMNKEVRRACQPVNETVASCRAFMSEMEGAFVVAMSRALCRHTGLEVTAGMIEAIELPSHLVAVIEIVDGDRVIGRGRDVQQLRMAHAKSGVEEFSQVANEHAARSTGLRTWDFQGLLEPVKITVGDVPVQAWIALVDEQDTVGTRLVSSEAEAVSRTRRGLCRLFLLNTSGSLRFQIEHLPDLNRITLPASVCVPG